MGLTGQNTRAGESFPIGQSIRLGNNTLGDRHPPNLLDTVELPVKSPTVFVLLALWPQATLSSAGINQVRF